MSRVSLPATLEVGDEAAPAASVVSPAGGEYWLLSSEQAPRNELVTWSMSDDIRLCRVEVRLLHSEDGGLSYQPVPANGGLLVAEGPGGACQFGEQPETTSVSYPVPSTPPSGSVGSLYKVEVKVIDHSGLTTVATSPNPFFIVQPNPETVRTLILSNTARMRQKMGITQGQADALWRKLQELAAHPRVQGFVVDLNGVTDLADPYQGLYEHWDQAPGDVARANRVLFGCHAPLPEGCDQERNGIHDVLLDLLEVYGGVEHVVVVGDDRIIPFSRLEDRTVLFPEPSYLAGGDLSGSSTVALALGSGHYLSDDPFAVLDRVRSEDLGTSVFIPDLNLGRLVETPEEITRAIATFISQDGVLDLGALHPETGHKVQVTGYDFLLDSSRRIRSRWRRALGLQPPFDNDDLAPLDGQLISPTWGAFSVAERRQQLLEHLKGNGGPRYGVISLAGHATHYEAGVPGLDPYDIQGLSVRDLYGPDACGTPGAAPADFAGSVVYSVGCHGGLPVPGSCAADESNSLDLPQTLLSRGVMAYLANTGYGWGLLHGIGYGERLVEILTEEMTRGGSTEIGPVARRSKLRYFLETPRFDPYDEKSLMQWALFGFPMYTLRTAINSGAVTYNFDAPARTLASLPAVEHIGSVTLRRQLGSGDTPRLPPPPFVTRLEQSFDFSGPGVFTKHNALGDPIPTGEPGCPEPAPGEPSGCYYTLNGLVDRGSGMGDLPIQPYFAYDSRLSGTSQHGVLWMGGTFVEEANWTPVIGQLASNGGDGSNHGSTPRRIILRPRPPSVIGGEDPDQCAASDLEASAVVVTAGEALKSTDTSPTFDRQRIHEQVDLEVLYFNNTQTGEGNCDRQGPEIAPPPAGSSYHHAVAGAVQWAIPVSDVAGVWRVIVVYTNDALDGQNRGRWLPLELADDGTGVWRGAASLPTPGHLAYLIQAVDRHGNVSSLDFQAAILPASGVPLGVPRTVEVALAQGNADLRLTMIDEPDPVRFTQPLAYTLAVANLGAEAASGIVVEQVIPGGATFLLGGGNGWSCLLEGASVRCTLSLLPGNSTSTFNTFFRAPGTVGPVVSSANVRSQQQDPDPSNDIATTTTTVLPPFAANLTITVLPTNPVAHWDQPLGFTIVVINHGPDDAAGALVSVDFPNQLGSLGWTCSPGPGATCPGSGTGDISTEVTLPAAGTLTIHASALVPSGTQGQLSLEAEVLGPSGMFEIDGDDNSSQALVPVSEIFSDGFESGGTSSWSVVKRGEPQS